MWFLQELRVCSGGLGAHPFVLCSSVSKKLINNVHEIIKTFQISNRLGSVLILPTSLNLGKNAPTCSPCGHRISVNTKPPTSVVFLVICASQSSRSAQVFEGLGSGRDQHEHSMEMEANAGTEETEDRMSMS